MAGRKLKAVMPCGDQHPSTIWSLNFLDNLICCANQVVKSHALTLLPTCSSHTSIVEYTFKPSMFNMDWPFGMILAAILLSIYDCVQAPVTIHRNTLELLGSCVHCPSVMSTTGSTANPKVRLAWEPSSLQYPILGIHSPRSSPKCGFCCA